ncbi:MAG: hypothetical protein JST04_08700 [Bdellovibrionales bacterium]|nr:hypothetical protein [Bdellovibrionales bacterium]
MFIRGKVAAIVAVGGLTGLFGCLPNAGVVSRFGIPYLSGSLAGGLSVASAPAAITQSACSTDALVVVADNPNGFDAPVSLELGGSLQAYEDAQCAHPISGFVAPDGVTSKAIYLRDDASESPSFRVVLGDLVANTVVPVRRSYNVLAYGASGSDAADDSAAFSAAISAAASGVRDFPAGPALDAKGTTKSQAIVYVPPGIYHLAKVYLASNVRLEIDANAVLRGAEAGQKCQSLFYLDTADSGAKLASDEPPITNVSLVGVGNSASARSVDPDWDATHSFELDDDPAHQLCQMKTNSDGSPATASVLPPMILVRNVTGFQIENVYSVQSYGPYPTIDGSPKYYPSNVIVFQSGVAGNFRLVKGAGGTTQYPPSEQTPVSEFTHPRFGVYRNHANMNAPAGYGPAQFQSGENLTVEEIYSRGGVALRLETDVAGNALDPDSNPSSPCLNYDGTGTDYRCYAWGSKLDAIHARKIKCASGNAGLYLAAHGQLNGAVDVADLETDNCYTGISESANTSNGSSGDPHLFTGTFSPSFSGNVEIRGSRLDGKGNCEIGGCLAQKPCSGADTWVPNVPSSGTFAVSPGAYWSVIPAGLIESDSFLDNAPACPK